jgi:fatty acid desaturase
VEAAERVRTSIRWQFALYGALLLLSFPGGNGFLVRFWLLPLLVGQPLLRFVLLAEHGGCAFSADGLANTRTALTLSPLRWLMWNMPSPRPTPPSPPGWFIASGAIWPCTAGF